MKQNSSSRDILDVIYNINKKEYTPAIIIYDGKYFLDSLTPKEKKEIAYGVYEVILEGIKTTKEMLKKISSILTDYISPNPFEPSILVIEKGFKIDKSLYPVVWQFIKCRMIEGVSFNVVPVIVTKSDIPDFFHSRIYSFYIAKC